MAFLAPFAPIIGAVAGSLLGKGSKGKQQVTAPQKTRFESLPEGLQEFATQQLFPRLEDVFKRERPQAPKRQAVSPFQDPLFASPELFALQRFANANQGAIRQPTTAPTTQETPTVDTTEPTSGEGLAAAFLSTLPGGNTGIKQTGEFLPPAATVDFLRQGSPQELGNLLKGLGFQGASEGFNPSTQFTEKAIGGIDFDSLIGALRGVQ